MKLRALALALAAAAVLVLAAPAAAQPQPTRLSPADSAELASYGLTETGVERYRTTIRALAGAVRADYGLRLRLDEHVGRSDISVGSLVAFVEGEPALLRGVREAGLTPREWVLLTHALVLGYFDHLFSDAGLSSAMEPRGVVSDANRAFIRAHLAEIEALMEEIDAVKGIGEDDGPIDGDSLFAPVDTLGVLPGDTAIGDAPPRGPVETERMFSPADSAVLAGWRLTDDRFTRLRGALRHVVAIARDSAALLERLEAEAEAADAGGMETIDGVVARYEAIPLLRRAAGAAGLSVRDYVLTLTSLGLAHMLTYPEAVLGSSEEAREIRGYVPPENLAFVRARLAEVEALMREMREAGFH